MTREEREKAIRILDDMKVKIDIPKAAVMQNDKNWALDMAIKALEQEPCEDSVSRQAVKDIIYEECSGTKLDIDFAKVLLLQRAVKALKPVVPIRSKGHWDIKDNMWWVCSACGCQTRMMKKYNVPRFCPACGAKMVEPQESEVEDDS